MIQKEKVGLQLLHMMDPTFSSRDCHKIVGVLLQATQGDHPFLSLDQLATMVYQPEELEGLVAEVQAALEYDCQANDHPGSVPFDTQATTPQYSNDGSDPAVTALALDISSSSSSSIEENTSTAEHMQPMQPVRSALIPNFDYDSAIRASTHYYLVPLLANAGLDCGMLGQDLTNEILPHKKWAIDLFSNPTVEDAKRWMLYYPTEAVIERVPGDGNCCFTGSSAGSVNHQDTNLRQEFVEDILNNPYQDLGQGQARQLIYLEYGLDVVLDEDAFEFRRRWTERNSEGNYTQIGDTITLLWIAKFTHQHIFVFGQKHEPNCDNWGVITLKSVIPCLLGTVLSTPLCLLNGIVQRAIRRFTH